MEYLIQNQLGGQTAGSALSKEAVENGYAILMDSLYRQTGGRRGLPLISKQQEGGDVGR